MELLYGRAGRLTAKNGGSRPGQMFAVVLAARAALFVCLPVRSEDGADLLLAA
jgi:hypothetical protein